MKVTADGFIWKVIPPRVARELYKILPIYRLHEDESEVLITWKKDIVPDGVYGLEVGFISFEDKMKLIRNIYE